MISALILAGCGKNNENPTSIQIQTTPILGQYLEDILYDNSENSLDTAFNFIENWHLIPYDYKVEIVYNTSIVIGEGYGQHFLDAIKEGNVHAVEEIMQKIAAAFHQNIMVGTLDEYRISYISFDYLLHQWPPQFFAFALPDFFESVRDYEHLIIDLRGTRGSIYNFFDFFRLVIRPNIRYLEEQDRISTGMYFFTNNVDAGARFYSPITNFSRVFVENNEHMLTSFNIPYLNKEHALSFNYVARDVAVFLPFYMLPPDRPFKGQIWILIDSYAGAGAQTAAWISQASGFAYLVGEAFSFDIEALRIQELEHGDFHITDVYGHALDKITPDHPNRPNMDALQTALDIILNQ